MKRSFKQLFVKKTSSKKHNAKNLQRRPSIEILEERLVPVVGAMQLPAAAPNSYTGVVAFDIIQPNGSTAIRDCSGALLPDGQHILTAAHCLWNTGGNNAQTIRVNFETRERLITGAFRTRTVTMSVPRTSFTFYTDANGNQPYNGVPSAGHDIAILTLPAQAPSWAERYELYRATDEVGKTVTIVGYGHTGIGSQGDNQAAGVRRMGENLIEVAAVNPPPLFVSNSCIFAPNDVLVFDFDSGNTANDLLGKHSHLWNNGLGNREAMLGAGDSGGPSFIGNQIAGINSYTGCNGDDDANSATANVDVNTGQARTFGEFAGLVRVSTYADWIDSVMAQPHDLVLDMNNERSANDGLPDMISARMNGNQFELFVNDSLVHKGLASGLRSINLFGSGDMDIFQIDGVPEAIPVTVHGRAGNDRFLIGHAESSAALGAMGAGITIHGGPGQDSVVLDDSAADGIAENWKADPWYEVWNNYVARYTPINGSMWPRSVTFSYANVEDLQLKGAANHGLSYYVESVNPATSLALQGGALDDTFILGSNADMLSPILNATIDGGDGFDKVVLNDRSNPAAALGPVHYALGPTYVQMSDSGLASTINFLLDWTGNSPGTPGHIESVELNTSNGDDIIDVYGTWTGLPVTINMGLGNDTMTLRTWGKPWTLDAPLTLTGDGGYDRLIVNDMLSNEAQTYEITADSIGRQGVVPIHFADMDYVELNAGNQDDVFLVSGTAFGSSLAIKAGDGNDSLVVYDSAYTLDAIQGWLDFEGQGGDYNNVVLYDFGNPVGQTYTIDALGTYRSGIAPITYLNLNYVVIVAGMGDDLFKLEHLAGGPMHYLDAYAGRDTLDYSHYDTDVYVDLLASIATDTGNAGGFENAIGGSANDTLFGDDGDNLLMGGGGMDQLDGRGGRNILIGGLGADLVMGGSDEDLLIAGTTIYEADQPAMLAIMAEWSRQDLTQQERIDHLLGITEGGLNRPALLTADAILDDGELDQVSGGDGTDWFLANLDEIMDWDGAEPIA